MSESPLRDGKRANGPWAVMLAIQSCKQGCLLKLKDQLVTQDEKNLISKGYTELGSLAMSICVRNEPSFTVTDVMRRSIGLGTGDTSILQIFRCNIEAPAPVPHRTMGPSPESIPFDFGHF
ncbi:hypothetical protein BC629DRAFT_1436601 [Irpex lacteus]|nr:hypothetical protein BC629DRAFT_1436601 [Irpex lacteus]